MPELPDVETFRRYFTATSLHQPVESVHVEREKLLEGTTPSGLGRRLHGQSFTDALRHGKYLLAKLDGGDFLVFHFGMTGFLRYYRNRQQEPEHSRVEFGFANGFTLAFDCQRLLGRLFVVPDEDALVREKELGPDALRVERDTFIDLFSSRKGMVKSTLMNQSVVAGIGNVYSDEILFQARVHPRVPLEDLEESGLETLFEEVREVLTTAIDCQADPDRMPDDYLLPHREEGASCPRCGGTVEKADVSGRSAYCCRSCQKPA